MDNSPGASPRLLHFGHERHYWRNKPRRAAAGRDNDFILSLEEVSERYAQAGHPRTIRTLQRYCASGHLDAQKLATTTGDKYLVTPQSVARHIAQIKELQALGIVATGRDTCQARR